MSIPQQLKTREITSSSSSALLTSKLEDSFFASYIRSPVDFLGSTENVLSTIAVAVSPDGETIASTHGDHTVKIFKISTLKLIRSFHGHPRTPWTVKYNPVDSNVVASGCLGCDVRLWNIQQGICLNTIRYENCIITLSFHPSGEFLMVSSGTNLHVWDWREGQAIDQSKSSYISQN
jgi:WD40 repeat protein